MKNDLRSYDRNFCNCVKKPEKIQDFNGAWTRDLAIPVRRSTNLSKQGIRWPVSRDHIAGSSWVLIEVNCFFFKLTADQVLDSHWIAGSSQAKTRLHFSRAGSTSSSKHLYSRRLSCLGGKRFGKKKFPPFFGGFKRKQVGHYSLRVCERKDRVVWQGFNHAGAVIERCCVLNSTVLPLKILNWSSFLGRDGKQHRVTVSENISRPLRICICLARQYFCVKWRLLL